MSRKRPAGSSSLEEIMQEQAELVHSFGKRRQSSAHRAAAEDNAVWAADGKGRKSEVCTCIEKWRPCTCGAMRKQEQQHVCDACGHTQLVVNSDGFTICNSCGATKSRALIDTHDSSKQYPQADAQEEDETEPPKGLGAVGKGLLKNGQYGGNATGSLPYTTGNATGDDMAYLDFHKFPESRLSQRTSLRMAGAASAGPPKMPPRDKKRPPPLERRTSPRLASMAAAGAAPAAAAAPAAGAAPAAAASTTHTPTTQGALAEKDVVLLIHSRGKMTLKELVTEFKAYVSQSKDLKKEFMGLIKAIAYMTEVDGIKYAKLNEATLVKYDLEQQ